jgi:hypothetical protein
MTHTSVSESQIWKAVKRSIRGLLLDNMREFSWMYWGKPCKYPSGFYVSRQIFETNTFLTQRVMHYHFFVSYKMCYCKVSHNTDSKIERPQFSFCFVKYKTHIQTFYEYCIFYWDLLILYYYIIYFILFYTKQSVLDYVCFKIRHTLPKNKNFHDFKNFECYGLPEYDASIVGNLSQTFWRCCQSGFSG